MKLAFKNVVAILVLNDRIVRVTQQRAVSIDEEILSYFDDDLINSELLRFAASRDEEKLKYVNYLIQVLTNLESKTDDAQRLEFFGDASLLLAIKVYSDEESKWGFVVTDMKTFREFDAMTAFAENEIMQHLRTRNISEQSEDFLFDFVEKVC
jgi:hypothetical protein